MSSSYQSIPLDQLRFGHEADPPLNPRRVGRTADLETLAASLLAHGQGQAVNARTIAGTHYVIDGNRRLAALRLLAERGKLPADHPVKVDLDSSADSGELSLALNLERVAMHEADTLEAFRDLNQKGLGEAQIAARFGIEPARVRRMLAIGNLHPSILEAWRNDEFQQPVDMVRAFTLAASLEIQATVYKRLKDEGRLYPHHVRSAVGADDRDAGKLMVLVGTDAYVAAGGALIVDLFGENHVIGDVELLRRLADEKLQAKCASLIAEGWSWSALGRDMPDNWAWNWEKVRPTLLDPSDNEAAEIEQLQGIIGKTDHWERTPKQKTAGQKLDDIRAGILVRSFTDEHKSVAGAVVTIGHTGSLEVSLGVKRPSASPKASVNAKAKPASGLSNALMARLSVQLTQAVQDCMAADPRVGLAAMLAGLSVKGVYGQPVRLKLDGMGAGSDYVATNTGTAEFGPALQRFAAMSDVDLIAAAAAAVSTAINMTVMSADHAPLENSANAALTDALPGQALTIALKKRFDAADFFGGASKSIIVAAVAECLGADEARKAEGTKKADLVRFAMDSVAPTGWLPHELRTSHYTGPGAVKAPAAKKPRAKKSSAAQQVEA